GTSVICVMFTLQPSLCSSTYLATYVLAVEPAHACSLSVTVPHLAFDPAVALPTASAAPASASARTGRSNRLRLDPRYFDIQPSSSVCSVNDFPPTAAACSRGSPDPTRCRAP